MAIYHCRIGMIGRSGEGNPVKALAYIAATRSVDRETGEVFDFRKKSAQDVQILLPESAPEWAKEIQRLVKEDREKGIQLLSDIVNKAEKRSDSQVYREVEVSLPRELTYEQNKALAEEYVQDQFCSMGMLAIQAFHTEINDKTGELNPHCHNFLLTRELAEEGLAAHKTREWNSKAHHETWREQWAQYASFHLKMHGYDVTLDHRSYKDQGIDLEPQPKLGKGVQEQEKRAWGIDVKGPLHLQTFLENRASTNKMQAFREVQLRNLYRIVRKPEVIFDIVTRNHTTFMWGDIQKVLHRYVDSPELFERLEARLKNSKDLLLLKPEVVRDGGKEVREAAIYTTHRLLQDEKALVKTAEVLAENKTHSVSEDLVERRVKTVQEKMEKNGHKLSSDQEKAILHLVGEGQLKCIVGYAGAGKTTALETCREIWEEQGYRVYGLAPTGRAAKNLEDSGIQSQTLHRFLKSFDEGRAQYSKESVLVLDEGGMVDVERFQKLLSAVRTLGVKAVVIGDGAQLQPVEAGPAFRIVTARVAVSRLEEIVRQKEGWQREATVLFGRQETQEALQAYQARGHLHIAKESLPQGCTPEGVIKRYEMTARTAGLIFREISREIGEKGGGLQQARAHRDYKRFEALKEIQKSAAREILSHAKDYRPYLEERGLNPLEMARLFADKKKDKAAQYKEAMDILKKRKLEHLIGAEKPKGQSIDVRTAAKDALINHWKKVHKENPDKSLLIMAYSNRDVRDLNEKAREYLKAEGKLEKGEKIYTISRDLEDDFGRKTTLQEERVFSKGDRIVFTRNKRDLGVSNGSMGTILSLETNKMTVLLDNGKDKHREVTFAPKMFSYFDQGYAVTIHKSQGTTIDKSFVLASHEMNQNLTYVAMTRHREDVHVYGSSLDFWREEKVAEVLSKSGDKLGAADYLDARSLANLMKEEDRFLEKFFTRVSDELQAMGAVTKQAFEKVATRFFGWDLQKERSIFVPPEILREEQRAKDLLYGGMKAEEVSYGHPSEPEQGRTPERRAFIDAGKVEEALKQNMASFADDIFSSLREPLHKSSSSAIQRRYGKNGHISVNLRTGAWINFKDSELSGGPLHMLTKLKGMEFKEAIEYGASWAGIGPERNLIKPEMLAPRHEERHSAEKEISEQEEGEKRSRIEKAQALWAKGELIKGTLADRYLKEHRKIARASSYDLRLLPDYKDPASGKSFPCLMAAARTSLREITAVQLTYLDPATGDKADIPVQKKSFGVLKGSFVTLQEGTTDKPIFVAEGIETALSIKEAGVPGTVMASLGLSNLKHLASASWSVAAPRNSNGDISPEKILQRIIICADHDDPGSVAAKSLEKSVHFLQEKGHLVTVIKPEKLHEDFNDVLKAHGDGGVKSYVRGALNQVPLAQDSMTKLTQEKKIISPVAAEKTENLETAHEEMLKQESIQKESSSQAGKFDAKGTECPISPALQAVYEDWKHPAFASATQVRRAFERGYKIHGEEKAIAYWESKKEALLHRYHQNLAKIEKELQSPLLAHLSDRWKDKARQFAKHDPLRVLNVIDEKKEDEIYKREKEGSGVRETLSQRRQVNKNNLGETYIRFKELSRTLGNTLFPPITLREEFKRLGYELSQYKGFMDTLRREDSKAVKMIERASASYEQSLSLEKGRGGFSL